jgi:uncharacterized protein
MNSDFSQLDGSLQDKLRRCQAILKDVGQVMVAFSGGVDSTFLLALAAKCLGTDHVQAGMGVSPSLPQRERQQAHDLAARLAVKLIEVETCEMDNPQFAANPPDRCYHCKSDLFARLKELAGQNGGLALICGANADDSGDYRPGLQAGEKLGVRNPLMEAGLTKAEIRQASRAMNLPTWDKPAMACLASRIPYGQAITLGKLARIERAEYVLKDMGFSQCRVRDHETLARIEVQPDEIDKVAQRRDSIVQALQALGYNYVTVDLQGFRSGSMNETL